jgi:hypothetical protein
MQERTSIGWVEMVSGQFTTRDAERGLMVRQGFDLHSRHGPGLGKFVGCRKPRHSDGAGRDDGKKADGHGNQTSAEGGKNGQGFDVS